MTTNKSSFDLGNKLSERKFMFKSVYKDMALKNIRGKVTKYPKTFRMEVNEKKVEIQKMVHKKIACVKVMTVGSDNKPAALEQLQKGLKKFFFGEKGEVTRKYPMLSKEFKYYQYKKKNDLQQKINMGPLTYYYLQDNNGKTAQRNNEVRRCALKRSQYFIIENDKEIDDYANNKKYNSRNRTHLSLLSSNNYFKTTTLSLPKEKEKEHLTTLRGIHKPEIQSNHSFVYFNTTDDINANNNDNQHCKSLSNKTDFPTKQRVTKKLFKSIISKASAIQFKQESLGKRLFTIIDKAHIEKPMGQSLKNDIETIFGMKIKKQSRARTKELFVQAVRVKDDYTNMDKKKADMLKLSDGIKNMTDDYALSFGKELTARYWKQSKGDRYSMPLEMVKEQERQHSKIRKRIDDKTSLLQKMEFHLQHDKNHLIDMLNSVSERTRY